MYQEGGRPSPTLVDITDMNIQCAMCNQPVTKLPFTPTKKEDGTYGRIYCFECNKKRRNNFQRM